MSDTIDERGGWTHASNAEADTACPGRHLKQRGLPEPPPGPDADRGRRIHEALRTGDFAKLAPDELECAEALREIEGQILRLWAEPEAELLFHKEQRGWLDIGSFKHSGQSDYTALDIRNGRGLIIDYKTGRGDTTESSGNGQLRDLAVLLAFQFGIYDVTVAIAQEGMKPELCRYGAVDLAEAFRLLGLRVTSCNDPQAPRIAGELQCKYCRATGICEEHKSWLAGGLPLLRQEPVLPLTPASQWTPNQRALFLDRLALLQQWLDQHKDECFELLLKDPAAVPGYKIGKPVVREAITDPETVFARFVQLGGRPEAFMAAVKVGKTDLKNAVRSVTGKKGKDLNAALDTLTDGCVVAKECKPSIQKV